jgi:3-oxoacyl-[acyl-carrier protein] reductase
VGAAPLLAGETALVTGGGSGIGRAIGVALAREGARVALADIDRAKGDAATAALVAEGCEARFIETDLAAPGAADALFDAAVEALGRVSLLVHSASPRRREEDTVFAVSEETWAGMVAVNLESAFRLGRRAGAHMKERAIRGRMLFITSLHAESPRNLPHYSASKAGMTMLMKELARALGPAGIRVNALAPGAVAGGGFVPDAALAAKIALGRLAAAEDIAPMAVALLADRFSAYVTGTTVIVDGGLALHNWIEPPG